MNASLRTLVEQQCHHSSTMEMNARLQLNRRRPMLTAFIAVLSGLLVSALPIPVSAQKFLAPWVGIPSSEHVGAPKDWSHRNLIYSNPDTRDEAARKGARALEEWTRNQKDPRFVAQLATKEAAIVGRQDGNSGRENGRNNGSRNGGTAAERGIHADWSNVMGGASGVGRAGVFPAKFNFDINATESCANDFVVYTTASSGATGSGARATRNGTFTGTPTNGQTVTITNGTRSLVLTASTTLNTGTNFLIGASTTARATNLKDAILRNGGTVGVTASSATNVVTVTAIMHGTGGNSIALARSLTGFAWAGATLAGGSGTVGQPTIIAFNQLYKTTCATTSSPVPATFWSYNTGNAAFTETSPVLSIDGVQVAFVQRTGTAASLVLLKWSSTVSVGTVGAPTAPTTVTAANYRTCTAPCMTVIAFNGGPNNTNSSPFYDYTNDELYVGADNGTLHKFTGVFNGTPAESGSPWPVTVSTGNILSSPVYDSGSGLVFVGSTSGTTTGGQLHSIDAISGALVSSARLATNSSSGVRDSPIVDSSAGTVYAFVGSGVGAAGTNCGTAPCASVYQFSTAFTGGSAGTKVYVGRGVTSTTLRFLYAGAFDDGYYSSGTPANPSGNLYVCGSLAATASRPTLWRIPITNNAMGTPVVGPRLTGNTNADCSPITEIMNGANDYLFVSVTAGGNDTGCTGACVYMYNLTGLTWGTGAVANAGIAAAGGASGIIVDNISSTTGASQVYYSTRTSPGNAVQASQALLQ